MWIVQRELKVEGTKCKKNKEGTVKNKEKEKHRTQRATRVKEDIALQNSLTLSRGFVENKISQFTNDPVFAF